MSSWSGSIPGFNDGPARSCVTLLDGSWNVGGVVRAPETAATAVVVGMTTMRS